MDQAKKKRRVGARDARMEVRCLKRGMTGGRTGGKRKEAREWVTES